MNSLDRFKTRMKYFGNNLRDEKIKNDKELLKETFKNYPSYKEKIYKWSVGKKEYTEKDLIGIRIYKKSIFKRKWCNCKISNNGRRSSNGWRYIVS